MAEQKEPSHRVETQKENEILSCSFSQNTL